MSDNSNWDKLIEGITDAYLEEETRDLPQAKPPSERYQRWEAKVIYKRGLGRFWVKTGRKIAVVLAICFVLSQFTMIVNAANGGVGFFTDKVGEWLHVLINGEKQTSPETIEAVYFPTYIPEGYEQIQYKELGISLSIVWENGDNTIAYTQSILGVDIYVKEEGAKEKYFDDIKVLYSVGDNYQSYYWRTEEYQHLLSFHGESIDASVLEKIIVSIKPKS